MTEAAHVALPDSVRVFLASGRRFATIATIDPDGAPRQAVIWYRLDGDHVVINSAVGRRWPTNLLREPTVALAIADPADPYRYVAVTGLAEAIPDQPTAQADIAAMARHYHADDPEKAERLIRDRYQAQERISFRVRVLSVHDYAE
jgi:PPOX class probable F420-dependent enzyme